MRPELAERAFADNKLVVFVGNIGECRRKITKTITLKALLWETASKIGEQQVQNALTKSKL